MSAKNIALKKPLAVVLAIAAATLAMASAAEAAKRKPARYYFDGVCAGSSYGCTETLMTVAKGKRFEIEDASCRAYLPGSGEAVKLAIWVLKNGNLKSIHDLVPTYTGMQGSSRYYIGGRTLNAWAGPNDEIRFESYASGDLTTAHCTLTGELVTLK
jgi:hypothetical protein